MLAYLLLIINLFHERFINLDAYLIEKVLGHASNSLQANGKGWNSAKINKNGKVGK